MDWRDDDFVEDDWRGQTDDGDDEDSDEDGDQDGSEVIDCPYCQREIDEDSQRCPYCEQYISEEDAPPRAKPWWILLGFAACAFAVYTWIRCGR